MIELTVAGPFLLDAPLAATVGGCRPGTLVSVDATTELDGTRHRATARFCADDAGTVDLARHTSLGGSYTGVDPFGLWWAADVAGAAAGHRPPAAPVPCAITVTAGGETATTHFDRYWLGPGTTAEQVDHPGVRGMFARPAGAGPFPAVVAFGGSGGGLGPAAAWAPILASHGFATLAVAYFGAPGLPEALVRIEVEVVERAVRWLLDRPDVVDGGVAVMGQSRGSELALLAGVLLDDVRAVAAFAPSGICWAGLDAGGPVDAPAWTFRGDDLPCVPIGEHARRTAAPTAGPVALRPAFEAALAQPALIEPAVIPVERAKGPILLVSGAADAMWPSTAMSRLVEERAPDTTTHLVYEDAGHTCVGLPGVPSVVEVRHPLTGGHYSFGGTRLANAHARADSWPRILDFLGASVDPSV